MPRGAFKHRYLCFVVLFEKIYYDVPILTVFSNIGEDVYNTVISIECMI